MQSRGAMRPLAVSVARMFIGSVVIAGPALAQTQSQPPRTLGEIVVRGTAVRDVQTGDAVDAGQRRQLGAATSDFAALLTAVPGMQLQGAGGVSSLPVMRGLADDRNRIKVDGMDLISSCANHMNAPLSYLSPSNTSSMTVFAGVSPVSLGGDAIGSTIVADTAAPVFAAKAGETLVRGELGAYYRSNGDALGVNAGATLATAQASVAYHGAAAKADNYVAGDGFRTTTATGRVGHTLPTDEVGSTAYRVRNHTLDIAYREGAHRVEAKIGFQDAPEQLYPNQRMDMLGNEQRRINLRYVGEQAWGTLDARVYHEYVEHLMDFGADKRYWYGAASGGPGATDGSPCSPISATCAAGMPMNTESTNVGVVVKAEVAAGDDALWRFGVEAQQYRLDDWWPASGALMWPNLFWNVQDGKRERAAVFAEREVSGRTAWAHSLGARVERVRTDAGAAQPYDTGAGGAADANRFNARDHQRIEYNVDLAALARYDADAATTYELAAARKVRSPNLYERYTWRTRGMEMLMIGWFGDGNGYIGDIGLDAEKAHTLSAAVDWHAADRRWHLKASPYFTYVVDYIDAVRCPVALGGACTAGNQTAQTGFVYLQFANQTARIYGFDLSGEAPLARGGFGALSLRGVASYTRGENADTGDKLYNIMPHNTKLTLVHKTGGWDNGIEFVAVDAKDEVSAVRNEVRTPGYALLNLRVSHSWKNLRIDAGVDNVFDRLYFHPLGGAYNGQGTTMSPAAASAPAWGVPVPGAGRSYKVGVSARF